MSTAMSSFALNMLIFLVISWVVYALDRKFGKSWYRWYYDISHEEKLPSETVRGFVCGRAGRTQCKMAVLLSIVVTIGLATFGGENSLTWFFTWLFGIFATVFGFITGPLVMNLWGKREKVYTAIDQIESGKIDPTDSVKRAGRTLKSRLAGFFGKLSRIWVRSEEVSSHVPENVPEAPLLDYNIDPAEPVEMVAPDSISEPDKKPDTEVQVGVETEGEKELSPEEKIKRFTGG